MDKRTFKIKWIVIAILYVVLFFATWWITLSFDTYMHEYAHLAVNQNFGCNETYLVLDNIGIGGSTWARGCDPALSIEREYLHSLNEVIGYHSTSVINAVILIFYGITALFLTYLYFNEKARVSERNRAFQPISKKEEEKKEKNSTNA